MLFNLAAGPEEASQPSLGLLVSADPVDPVIVDLILLDVLQG
jgi:hypothetical protein